MVEGRTTHERAIELTWLKTDGITAGNPDDGAEGAREREDWKGVESTSLALALTALFALGEIGGLVGRL